MHALHAFHLGLIRSILWDCSSIITSQKCSLSPESRISHKHSQVWPLKKKLLIVPAEDTTNKILKNAAIWVERWYSNKVLALYVLNPGQS